VKKKFMMPVAVAVAVFILWNLISLIGRSSVSEMVQYGAMEKAFSATMYLFKDENVIDSGQNGILQTTVSDGERVHKGARVGALLSADTDESALNEFLQIEDRIERLSALDGKTAETFRTDDEITSLSLQITEAARKGDMTRVGTLKDALLVAKDERSAAEGRRDELTELLEGRQAALKEKIGSSIKEIFSPEAGSFLLGTDGLEKEMTTKEAEKLTVASLAELADRIGNNSGGCKILYNTTWRGACTIEAVQAAELQEGQTVTLRFRECGGESRKAEVLAVSDEQDGKCVVVFSTDKAPEGLMRYRKVTVDVILARYEGLRVPKEAIVEEGGQQGVYVQTVTEQVFKKAEVAYTGETYAIVREGQNTELKLYDTVVY